MDLKDGAHVDLWVIEGLVTELLDGGQTLASDVILQQVPELSKTVRNAGNKLKEANEYLITPQNSERKRKYLEHPAKILVLVCVEQVLEL